MTAPPQFAAVITGAVIATVFGAMLLLERVRPLRRTVEGKLRRVLRNLGTGGISLASVTLVQTVFLVPVARMIATRQLGLLHLVKLPAAVHVAAALLLLDYTLWIWHRANHRLPLLWRFHLVHHVDRDLDSSTALRFHFGELILASGFRLLQIVIIGASPLAVWIWQLILFASILFHHANIELPLHWERRLVRIIVTPRMHGIHHSDQLSEADSNWSSLLSCWDYLHGTLLLSVPQRDVVIGVPAWENREDVTIGRILTIPFQRQRRDWHRPDGSLQTRAHPGPPRELQP